MISNKQQQNGVVECMNKTIIEHTKSMGINVGLSKPIQADARNITAYLINKGPSIALEYFRLLEESLTEKKVHISHQKIFGCTSYIHIDFDKRSKLDPKFKNAYLLDMTLMNLATNFETKKFRKSLR